MRAREAKLNRRISYWLIPAEPQLSIFRQIISKLAERFAAPLFEPHVTLYSGPYPNSATVESILEAALDAIPPIHLRTIGSAHSREFTRTLFVKFEPSAILTKLAGALEKGSIGERYHLEPHLSLVYAPIPEERRARLAEELVVPQEVRFERVCAMETGTTVSRADVERWRKLAEMSLHCA